MVTFLVLALIRETPRFSLAFINAREVYSNCSRDASGSVVHEENTLCGSCDIAANF